MIEYGLGKDYYQAMMDVHYGRMDEVVDFERTTNMVAGFTADWIAAVFDGEKTYIDRGDPLSDAVECRDGNWIFARFSGQEIRLKTREIGSEIVPVNPKDSRRWARTWNAVKEV